MSASFTISQMAASSQLMKPSATIYVLGSIKDGHLQCGQAAYCKWELICNDNWFVEKGTVSGQTWEAVSKNGKCVWAHPLDLELRCKSVRSAPKLYIEVHCGGSLYGYGVMHLPMRYGKHEISIPVLRPQGSTADWLSGLLWGGSIRYRNPKQMLLGTERKPPHKTLSCGYVVVETNILRKGFPKYVRFDSE